MEIHFHRRIVCTTKEQNHKGNISQLKEVTGVALYQLLALSPTPLSLFSRFQNEFKNPLSAGAYLLVLRKTNLDVHFISAEVRQT